MVQGGEKVATLKLAIQDGSVGQSYCLVECQRRGSGPGACSIKTVGPAIKRRPAG